MEEKDRAVLYLRLSKEDQDKLSRGDDSASIQNQRLMLLDYALQHNYQIKDIYSDDDESGLFDTRPEFERMLADARCGKFDVVIAKSQSRFSRNMEHVEKYLHHDFPSLGIRFIGVADGADTADLSNKKSRQVNGLVNEWYCEDLSKNIRSAFQAKMRDGQYLGASCPYGYRKDPKNHNHLVVDEYAASVVRQIYSMYLQGLGKAKIARRLTEEGIQIPTLYKREVLGINYYHPNERSTTKGWSYQTIHTILNNEVYIGNVVQNKYNNLSYKDKKHVRLPRDQWIRVTETHEAVIEPAIFKRVQERQRMRTKEVASRKSTSVFAGVLFCGDCKHAMVRMYERRGEQKFIGYCCRTYKTQGKAVCSRHAVNDERLKEAVLAAIQKEAGEILPLGDVSRLGKTSFENGFVKDCRIRIRYLEKELERKKIYQKKTYQNYMDEVLSEAEYVSYSTENKEEICSLEEKIKGLKEQIKRKQDIALRHDDWTERFINNIDIDELTREVVLELIERIEVYENGKICIHYKFCRPDIQAGKKPS